VGVASKNVTLTEMLAFPKITLSKKQASIKPRLMHGGGIFFPTREQVGYLSMPFAKNS